MFNFKQIAYIFIILCFMINYFVIGNMETSATIRQDTGKRTLSCRFCGLTSRQKIIGGRDAHVHDFPWMVTIRFWEVNICGGSIINSRYVITAAHCVTGKILVLLSVVISMADVLDTREISYAVADAIGHEQFDPDTYDYDIGLIRLVRPIKFGRLRVRPVCLPDGLNTSLDFSGKLATVVGWGAVNEDGRSPKTARLHRVTVPIVANDICRNASGLKGYAVTSRMLCAGYLTGGKDACQGDSGGPLMIKNHVNGVWEQVGIVSWGVGCGKPNYYGMYSRVSYFIDWLTENMWDWSC